MINPEELLSDVTSEPNSSDRHLVDTQGGTIEKFWSCETLMEGAHGSCKWQITDVTRALHSVSTFAWSPGQAEARCILVSKQMRDSRTGHR